MTYEDKFIYVGNQEKGYALINTYTGEFLSGFDYSSVVPTRYGIHFLYKEGSEESCTIVDDNGKTVSFNKDYFWGSLAGNHFGVGYVLSFKDNKYYFADCKGNILSKGYDRKPELLFKSARIYKVTNVVKDSGRKFKGLVDAIGREIVACVDEYIPEYDDIFVLLELIEKYGPGLFLYASDEILASDMLFLKVLEASVKSLRTLPDSIDKYYYINAFVGGGIESLYFERKRLCMEKDLKRESAEVDVVKIRSKFNLLIDTLFEEGTITNRIVAQLLQKEIGKVLEMLFGNSVQVFIF